MKKSRFFYGICGLIILSVVGIGYLFFGPASKERVQDELIKHVQLLEFNGADLHEEKDGKLLWAVKAEKIMVNPQTKDAYLTNAKAELHQNGTTIFVDATKASITDNKTLITLTGHVEAKTADGATFKGEDLVFNMKTQKLESKKAFTYKKGSTKITGDSLTGDMLLKHLKAKGHVKVVEE